MEVTREPDDQSEVEPDDIIPSGVYQVSGAGLDHGFLRLLVNSEQNMARGFVPDCVNLSHTPSACATPRAGGRRALTHLHLDFQVITAIAPLKIQLVVAICNTSTATRKVPRSDTDVYQDTTSSWWLVCPASVTIMDEALTVDKVSECIPQTMCLFDRVVGPCLGFVSEANFQDLCAKMSQNFTTPSTTCFGRRNVNLSSFSMPQTCEPAFDHPVFKLLQYRPKTGRLALIIPVKSKDKAKEAKSGGAVFQVPIQRTQR